jgi:hypothetical protein
MDGNKRTAFAATYTFLLINGYEFIPGAENDSVQFVSGLYEANSFEFTKLAPWRRSNTMPTPREDHAAGVYGTNRQRHLSHSDDRQPIAMTHSFRLVMLGGADHTRGADILPDGIRIDRSFDECIPKNNEPKLLHRSQLNLVRNRRNPLLFPMCGKRGLGHGNDAVTLKHMHISRHRTPVPLQPLRKRRDRSRLSLNLLQQNDTFFG